MADTVSLTTPIAEDQAAQHDPRRSAPPVITRDGHVHTIGHAHGRVAPLVGNYRPYLYDVALPDGRRIYADQIQDVLDLMLGDRYNELTAQLAAAAENQPATPEDDTSTFASPVDFDPLPDLGEDATADDLAAFEQAQNHQDAVNRMLYEQALIRRKHADGARIELQQQINTAAQQDGRWGELTADEQELLTAAADPEGIAPVGVFTEVPDFDPETGPGAFARGRWSAKVKLVVNTGDFDPWMPVPFPESTVTATGPDGHLYEGTSLAPLVVLRIDTPDDYLLSLRDAGYLRLQIKPHEPADDIASGVETILLDSLGWGAETAAAGE